MKDPDKIEKIILLMDSMELTYIKLSFQAPVIGQRLVKLCMESDWTKLQYDETSTRLLVEGNALPHHMRREKW